MRSAITVLCFPFVLCFIFGVAEGLSAQTVELGGSLAAACAGSDGSICDDFEGTRLLVGAHASWWAANRIELGARLARMGLPSHRFRAFQSADVEWFATDRSRQFVSFLFIYHFLRGHRVRPMLGLGSGWYAATERVTCPSAGCEALLPREVTVGNHRTSMVDAILVIGLSGVVRERWVWRAGWQPHRLGNDENSSEELFVGVGYRFGRL